MTSLQGQEPSTNSIRGKYEHDRNKTISKIRFGSLLQGLQVLAGQQQRISASGLQMGKDRNA